MEDGTDRERYTRGKVWECGINVVEVGIYICDRLAASITCTHSSKVCDFGPGGILEWRMPSRTRKKNAEKNLVYFYLQHTFAIISPRSWCLATNKQAHPGVEHELDARENCRPEDIITFLVRELSKKKEEKKKKTARLERWST